jgi:hypothetical protein
MYLAADGKIYMTSGGPVLELHCMNYPDSAGIACDFNQHSVPLPCYHVGGVPNHPNYYLGPISGSICDSLGLFDNEIATHSFNFEIRPNPSAGRFAISYSLPPNVSGGLSIYNDLGQVVFKMPLSAWSTKQIMRLDVLEAGIYLCVIESMFYRASSKILIVK